MSFRFGNLWVIIRTLSVHCKVIRTIHKNYSSGEMGWKADWNGFKRQWEETEEEMMAWNKKLCQTVLLKMKAEKGTSSWRESWRFWEDHFRMEDTVISLSTNENDPAERRKLMHERRRKISGQYPWPGLRRRGLCAGGRLALDRSSSGALIFPPWE